MHSRTTFALVSLLIAAPILASPRLWVLKTPDEIPVPPPSVRKRAVPAPVAAASDEVRYWSAGAPNYRWHEVMFELFTS
ncbi:MAG TPA: hypothetical protein VFV49_01080, partial [Thermoanaerobaculia bacterium]|nr:hypothetical protein [Thermoanaerobaculia bacterium]